jgi:hypothetical protein
MFSKLGEKGKVLSIVTKPFTGKASEKTIKDTTSNTYDNVIAALPSGVLFCNNIYL